MSTNRPATTNSHRATAERNIEAILDAGERLLGRGEQPTISAVAVEAALSRPTVYAHFRDRRELLAALVARTVRRAMSSISSAEPGRGPAADALGRLIATSWKELATHDQIAHAAAGELSAKSMRAAHESARDVILQLIERGRAEGTFRSDVPAGWLVTASLALIHAATDEVARGELDADLALEVLSSTIVDLFRARPERSPARKREKRIADATAGSTDALGH